MSEFVIIARSILLLKYLLPEAKKSFNRHPGIFQKFIMASDYVRKIPAT